jgi:hypothetical protein
MKMLTRVLACMAIVTIACGTLLAAQHPSMAMTKGVGVIHPMHIDKKLKTIYTNLGSSSAAYDSTNGWLVMGSSNTLYGYSQDIAMPFTPKKSATATEIKIGLTYDNSGANGGTVALYSDSGGLPGTSLKSADVKNLPTFGTCCTVATAKLGKGVKVKAKTQYWAVGTTDTTYAASVDVWNYVYGDATGNFAFRQSGGSWNSYDSTLCGYGGE